MRSVSEPICSRIGPRAGKSASGMCSGALFLWRLLAGHLGKRAPKDLTAPRTLGSRVLRAATHQCLARADYGKVGLGAFAPVPEWVQELRIHSCQAGEVLKASTSSVFRLLWRR